MTQPSDGFDLFKTTLRQLLECSVMVEGNNVTINKKVIATEDPTEQRQLALYTASVLQRSGQALVGRNFGDLTQDLKSAATIVSYNRLEQVVQLLATHFFEAEKRDYGAATEIAMIDWAKRLTGLQGQYTLSDAFGIWVVHEFAPKAAPA